MADMNAQQIAAINERATRAVIEAVQQINLRKYAVETATALWASSGMQNPPFRLDAVTHVSEKIPGIAYSPIELARMIYDFMIEPAQQINIKIEQ